MVDHSGLNHWFKYSLKKIITLFATLFSVTIITFLLMNITPGETAASILQHTVMPVEETPPQWMVNETAQRYNLNEPLTTQYLTWLDNALHGNLGQSYVYNQPVAQMVAIRIGPTAELAFFALGIALLVGIPFGILCAIKKNKITDYVIRIASIVSVSIPTFWLGLMLIIVFSIMLGLYPTSGYGGLNYLILPSLALAAHPTGVVIRITRTSVLETLGQQHVTFARAKGLSVASIMSRHVLKNAMLPTLTVIGMEFGGLLGGTVVIESIFNWPGVGSLLANSVLAKDIPVVMGCVIAIVAMYVVVNMCVDVAYTIIDPRIRTG